MMMVRSICERFAGEAKPLRWAFPCIPAPSVTTKKKAICKITNRPTGACAVLLTALKEGILRVAKTEIAASDALQRYYPWVVIGIAFLTVAVAFGTRNAFAVFLVAVIEEFRWSRGLASGALMLGSIMWTLSAPVIGYLLDRFGPRIVLPGGAIIMAIGFIISGFANSVIEFYIGMGVFMGVGFAALPMTSQATFLSNWFIRKRGMAIGAAASGIGLGILLVVPWTQWLVATYGWRAAFFILAGLLALIVAPLNYFFQRQRPDEMNLEPDFGDTVTRNAAAHAKAAGIGGPSLRDALRTWRFWAFAIGVLAGAIPLHMVLIHQVAAVSDAGFSKELAALRPRTDRTVYRAGNDFHGVAGRPHRPSMVLPARLGIVDDRHFASDADHRCQPELVVLRFSAVYRGRFLIAPVALPDHRRRSLSRQIVRRDHRRDLAIYRRRGGYRALARRCHL